MISWKINFWTVQIASHFRGGMRTSLLINCKSWLPKSIKKSKGVLQELKMDPLLLLNNLVKRVVNLRWARFNKNKHKKKLIKLNRRSMFITKKQKSLENKASLRKLSKSWTKLRNLKSKNPSLKLFLTRPKSNKTATWWFAKFVEPFNRQVIQTNVLLCI